jgi:short-subunit dehydrogenase
MKWNDSVAIVTGASRGIGEAVARTASARGARVGLIARSKDDLARVQSACPRSAIAVADMTSRAETDEAIAALQRELGPCDILVNNAGAGVHGFVADTDVDAFEQMIRVNYFSTVYATKAVLPGMLERRRGHLVMVSSIAGRIGAPLEAAYSASKFAVTAFAEALSAEVAPHHIGVSSIYPGPVATDFFDARGVPYQRKSPKPVSAQHVADVIVTAVERGQAERYIPGALRAAFAAKALSPPALFALGTKGIVRDASK